MTHQDELLTFNGLSAELRKKGMTRGIAVQTLHRWRAAGKLAAIRVGGTWYTTLYDFDRFVASQSSSSQTNGSHSLFEDASKIAASLKNAGW